MFLIYVTVSQNNGHVPSIETRPGIVLGEAVEAIKLFLFAYPPWLNVLTSRILLH
jgi:hypothetical protein